LFPKFVTEGAATYHELRKRGTSGGGAGFHLQFKLSSLRIVRQPNEAFSAPTIVPVWSLRQLAWSRGSEPGHPARHHGV